MCGGGGDGASTGPGVCAPSACAAGQEDEGVVGSVRLGLDAVCLAAVPSCFPSVIGRSRSWPLCVLFGCNCSLVGPVAVNLTSLHAD